MTFMTITRFINVHHLGIGDLKIPSNTGLLAIFLGVMVLIKHGFARRTDKVYLSIA